MSSTEVAVSFPMPVCTYTIRRGSSTGAEIRFATVGEPVFHVWSCPSGREHKMIAVSLFISNIHLRFIRSLSSELFRRRRSRKQDTDY